MNYPWVQHLRTGFGYFISVHLAKIATYKKVLVLKCIKFPDFSNDDFNTKTFLYGHLSQFYCYFLVPWGRFT